MVRVEVREPELAEGKGARPAPDADKAATDRHPAQELIGLGLREDQLDDEAAERGLGRPGGEPALELGQTGLIGLGERFGDAPAEQVLVVPILDQQEAARTKPREQRLGRGSSLPEAVGGVVDDQVQRLGAELVLGDRAEPRAVRLVDPVVDT